MNQELFQRPPDTQPLLLQQTVSGLHRSSGAFFELSARIHSTASIVALHQYRLKMPLFLHRVCCLYNHQRNNHNLPCFSRAWPDMPIPEVPFSLLKSVFQPCCAPFSSVIHLSGNNWGALQSSRWGVFSTSCSGSPLKHGMCYLG